MSHIWEIVIGLIKRVVWCELHLDVSFLGKPVGNRLSAFSFDGNSSDSLEKEIVNSSPRLGLLLPKRVHRESEGFRALFGFPVNAHITNRRWYSLLRCLYTVVVGFRPSPKLFITHQTALRNDKALI